MPEYRLSPEVKKRAARLGALDVSIAHGLADAEAGRTRSMDAVFGKLEAKYRGLADASE